MVSPAASWRTAKPFVAHPRIERRIGVKRRRSALGLRGVECLSLIFIAVVGIKVEAGDDLHWSIRKRLKRLSLQTCISDCLYSLQIELIGKVSPDGVGMRRVVSCLADVID